ncbi:hypothetical protein BH09PSE5_BH09PSE5_48860 [soil metagenome]
MSGSTLPGGAKVAVVFQFVFEQWGGTHVEPGRHTAPQLPLSAIKDGVPDLVSLSWQDYAGRAGMYRLMDTARKHGVVATGLFNGLAVERYPDVAREFARDNEIAAHSWSEDVRCHDMSDDDLRADVRKTRSVIEDTTGYRPVGWCSSGYQGAANTVKIVAEEGFDYIVERVDDERPALLDTGGVGRHRKLVGIAPSFDVNDHQLYARGHNAPSAYIETFTRNLDVLLSEPAERLPMLTTAVFHATLFGHPMGAWALRECIRKAQATPGVLITTHRECAAHCLEAWS